LAKGSACASSASSTGVSFHAAAAWSNGDGITMLLVPVATLLLPRGRGVPGIVPWKRLG
jgi:hypothetical protein